MASYKLRLGPPEFLIAVCGDRRAPNSIAYSVNDVDLHPRLTRNGRPASVEITRGIPWGYSSTSDRQSYRFSADPGDSIQVSLSLRAVAKMEARDAHALVVAHWTGLEVWDWWDGTSMGKGISVIFETVATGLGLLIGAVSYFVWPRRPTATA